MDMLTVEPAAPRRATLVATDGRTYPLERAHVEARAEGGLALTTLRQHFRNPWPEALEVEYTLPLPADGAVLAYVVQVGERRIVGEIRTREVAEKAYREALYQGRTAGLLEQDRADTFQQRLGNIPPETPVEVEIRVLHPLGFLPAGGGGADDPIRPLVDRVPGTAPGGGYESPGDPPRWEYRFPTVVGVRYMGAPGRVPDAEGLDPDRASGGVPTRLTLDLLLADAAEGRGISSPSHPLRWEDASGPVGDLGGPDSGAGGGETAGGSAARGVRVRLAEGAPLDRDLVVRWEAPAPEVGVRVVEGAGLEGDDGRYALVTVLPPGRPTATFRRDLTILLDTSGSMHGVPLTLAKRVVESLLQGLVAGDRFEILTFGTRVQDLTGGMQPVGAGSVAEALSHLAAVYADGGTEMRSAVEQALRPLRPDAQRQVLLVTDGYIGFEGEVVAEAMRRLPDGVRFHAVGVGAAPNRTLTGGLARAGRGVEVFAGDEATADEAARRLAAAMAGPILTGLTVGGGGVRAVAPSRPRDVLAGQPVVLAVELAPGGGPLELTGALAGEGRWRWAVDVPPGHGNDSGTVPMPRSGRMAATPLPLGALHGRELLADLELEEAAGAPRQVIDRRIEAVALRHRIVSRRTSLVAVADEPSVDPRQPRRRRRLEVELPAGVSAEGLGLLGAGLAQPLYSAAPLAAAAPEASWVGSRVFEERVDLAAYDEAMPALVDPELAVPRAYRKASGEPSRSVAAEVIHHAPDLLLVEFEVPFDGFSLPRVGLTVVLEDGRIVRAAVDGSRSTPPGPHGAGVLVRLALVPEGTDRWPPVRRVTLRWGGSHA